MTKGRRPKAKGQRIVVRVSFRVGLELELELGLGVRVRVRG